jgi:hypothetical protein
MAVVNSQFKTGMGQAPKFQFPREVLLVEIERRCSFPDCAARNLVGLTKTDAIGYRGFECVKCERWNDDVVNPQELPDSWVDDSGLNLDNLTEN